MASLAAGADSAGKEAIGDALSRLEKKIVRGQVLNGEPRIDGRDTRTVRPDHDPHRGAAPDARFGAVHPR